MRCPKFEERVQGPQAEKGRGEMVPGAPFVTSICPSGRASAVVTAGVAILRRFVTVNSQLKFDSFFKNKSV